MSNIKKFETRQQAEDALNKVCDGVMDKMVNEYKVFRTTLYIAGGRDCNTDAVVWLHEDGELRSM